EHVLEALAALADELRGRAVEVELRGDAGVVAELLLDAADRHDAALVVVGRDQEHREALQTGERIVHVLGVFGPGDDEVVLAVARGDEDLGAGDEPVAVLVLLAAGAQPGHVAAGVGLGDVHAAPGVAAADLLDVLLPAGLEDRAVVGIHLGGAFA